MADEYNSQLIARLYSATKAEDIEHVLDEMAEIGNAVFIYPLYEAWKKNNRPGIFFSHYFISTLIRINSEEVLKVSLKIWADAISTKDKIWCYPIFEKYNYEGPEIIEYAQNLVVQHLNQEESLTSYNIVDLLEYLKKYKKIDDIAIALRSILINKAFEFDLRRNIIKYLWENNPKVEIKFFVDNYISYEDDDDLSLILAKTIIRWKGPLIDVLKEIMKVHGSTRAKEILKDEEAKKVKEDKGDKEKDILKYPNISLVMEISKLRNDINTISLSNKSLEIKLFDENESLISQQEIALSEDSFVNKCTSFRTQFTSINSLTKNHGLNEIEMKKLLPNIDNASYTKPINNLYFFLKTKGVQIESDVFGLREMNQIVNLFTHPDQKKALVKALNENKLIDLYIKKEWGDLHKRLLEDYKKSLIKMYESISKKASSS